ncbi:hypothetical protein [Castellaniella sp.]|uniref:hypothetical protein n=1 Tax=Castellaniella sp. TaxID=1955812 RepID=UPI00355E7BFA
MNQANNEQGQAPGKAPQDQALCPECGKPVYQCGCIARWEDEGGATEAGRLAEDGETSS